MPKVLIVTKDRMEFNLYHPVAELLRSKGVEVVIVAEGLSMKMWLDAGYDLYGGWPKEGDFDPNTLMRTDISPVETLEKIKPDLVMTGLAAPIHLGEIFGLAANGLDIPLGFVEDLWGVCRRSRAIPTFICTLDAYGQGRIDGSYLTAPGIKPRAVVTGSPAMDALKDLQPDPQTATAARDSGAKRVILIGGQDESTTPMMIGLLKMLRTVDYPCFIIPRFHPKWMQDAAKESFAVEWMRLLFQTPPLHKVWWTGPSVNTQRLILSADLVVSIYSNLLLEATVLGKMAVSWNSEIGQKMISEGLGETSFPLCHFGAVREVWSAAEAMELPFPNTAEYEDWMRQAQKVVRSDGKNAERAASAILDHLQ